MFFDMDTAYPGLQNQSAHGKLAKSLLIKARLLRDSSKYLPGSWVSVLTNGFIQRLAMTSSSSRYPHGYLLSLPSNTHADFQVAGVKELHLIPAPLYIYSCVCLQLLTTPRQYSGTQTAWFAGVYEAWSSIFIKFLRYKRKQLKSLYQFIPVLVAVIIK